MLIIKALNLDGDTISTYRVDVYICSRLIWTGRVKHHRPSGFQRLIEMIAAYIDSHPVDEHELVQPYDDTKSCPVCGHEGRWVKP